MPKSFGEKELSKEIRKLAKKSQIAKNKALQKAGAFKADKLEDKTPRSDKDIKNIKYKYNKIHAEDYVRYEETDKGFVKVGYAQKEISWRMNFVEGGTVSKYGNVKQKPQRIVRTVNEKTDTKAKEIILQTLKKELFK